MRATTFYVLSVALVCEVAQAGDWLQFRGSDSSGVSTEPDLPVQLDLPATLKWKTALPGRGLSGPLVVGDRIILTASSGYRDDRLHVLCFSVESGQQLWQRSFRATGRTVCHEAMCMATPQPCSDGERIYAYYSCNDVVCLDLDGNLIWYRGLGFDYPNTSSSLGMSSSPVVVDETLILQLDTDSESYAAGLDARTGETRWKQSRARSAVYASPAVYRPANSPHPQVVMQSMLSLLSVDPRTGAKNWELEEPCGHVASTTVSGDLLVAPVGALVALRSTGPTSPPEKLWSEVRMRPDTPSPVVYQDRVYVLKGSVLTCARMDDGKIDWQLRLNCNSSYASPLAGSGHLYLADQDGVLHTIRLGAGKGEVASRLELGETIMCTPALAGGALYVRSDGHLWKFANAN